MEGKIRKIITDKGVFYYKIRLSSTFDYFFLYRKEIIKSISHSPWWSNKEDEEILTDKYISIPSRYQDYRNEEHYDFIEKGGNRVSNIKEAVKKILTEYNDFDPYWDGIMVEDKAMLRELLIDDLIEEDEIK